MTIYARGLVHGCLLVACSAFWACGSDPASPSAPSTDDSTDATADAGSGGSKGSPDARVPPSKGGTTPGSTTPGSTTPTKPRADAGGGALDPGSMSSLDAGAALPPASAFPAVMDPSKDGPYKAKTVSNAGPGSNYTIFQPDPLGADGVKHPILTWGNGGSTTPDWYTMLPHLATHGFVVVAANTVPSIGAEEALGTDMLTGMDWMLMQNTTQGSEYFGKLDSARVAPFGYSMGGLATWVIVGDPRWITTVHLSGGNMESGPVRIVKAHAPMFWECGTTDIAGANCDTDFMGLMSQSVFYGTLNDVDHLGILEPGSSDIISGAVTAWFRYYLMDDQTFKPWFVGADCTLCKDTKTWKVQKKNYE